MAGNTNPANNNPSSFGIEIECIIGIQPGAGPFNKPRRFRTSPGNPIVVLPGEARHEIVQERVEQAVRNAAQGHKGDRVLDMTDAQAAIDQNLNNWHLANYRNWVVKRDLTVAADAPFESEDDLWVYQWQDIEITSPALYATEKSWDEVRHVVQTLMDTFWLYAPQSAGLHIHYGRGKDWIPFNDLRRISAFLYAADPILVQMHPRSRRTVQRNMCESNRLYSGIAHGASRVEAMRYTGANTEESPPETAGLGIIADDPEPRPSEERGKNFEFFFQRGFLEGYTLDQPAFDNTHPEYMEGRDRLPQLEMDKPLNIPTAVEELLSCTNAPTISLLMGYRFWTRMAYNFGAYGHRVYRRVAMSGATLSRHQPKRTIEFRQATGTLDPEEIIAHAKIAVGICDFASTTDIRTFWKLILDLTVAENHAEWYDVFDFLVDLDLNAEARIIQQQIAKQRGIDMRDSKQGKKPPNRSRGPLEYVVRFLASRYRTTRYVGSP